MPEEPRSPSAADRFAERDIAVVRNARGEVSVVRPDRVLVEADEGTQARVDELLRGRGRRGPAAARACRRPGSTAAW